MRMIGGIEDENDRLVQIWATRQRSYVSGRPAQCGHHYYTRRCELLRWDLKNIIPLTYVEHTKLHSGSLKYTVKNPCNLLYLRRMLAKNFKDYLFENNLTREEFAIKCNKKLKEALSAEDSENI